VHTKRKKKSLLNKLDDLDKKAETTPLDGNELNLKHALNNRLAELLREEEVKWYQRAKVKDLLEGEANTKYFQLVASGNHRTTRIFQLEQEEGLICGDIELKNISPNIIKSCSDHQITILCLWTSRSMMIFLKFTIGK